MEHALRQLGQAQGERRLAVLIPEESRIGEPRLQHALVAGDDHLAAVARRHVGNEEETGRKNPLGVAAGEIFLVRPHRCGQHLGRQIHERLVDGPHQNHRPFDQSDDLVEQSLVRFDLELGTGRRLGERCLDRIAPLFGVEDDLGRFDLGAVLLEVARRYFAAGKKAMPSGRIADRHAVEIEFQHLAVEQRQRADQGPHPAETRRRKAHGFGPGQGVDRRAQQPGQQFLGGLAGTFQRREIEFALVGRALLALLDRGQSRRFEKAFDRLRRRAHAWPAPFFAHARPRARQARHRQRQTPRRDEGLDACGREARLVEGGLYQALQLARCDGLHARRDFLGQQFQQQIGHQLASLWSQVSQQDFASARTRPI